MDVNIPELKAFVAAANFGNFTRAAESLHISQPALSRRIGLVEHALGAPVFDRVGGGAQLTAVGQAFLVHATGILAGLQDAVEAAHMVQRGERGEIVLAVANSLFSMALIGVLDRFRQSHGGIDLVLHTGTSAEVSALVLKGEALLGVRFRTDPHPNLECRVVGQDSLVVVCSPRHRLAGAHTVSRAQLAEETWIGYPAPAMDPGGGFARALARYGIAAARTMNIEGLEEQKRTVAANFGLGMFPTSNVLHELRAGTLCRVQTPSLHVVVPFALIRRKGVHLGVAASHLEERIGNALQESVPEPAPPHAPS